MAMRPIFHFLLLITSNGAARASQLAAMADQRLESESGVHSNERLEARENSMSKSEVQALLSLKFAEPLPVVMKRVKATVAAMPLGEAVTSVGHKLSTDVHSFIQQPNNTATSTETAQS